VNNTELVQSYRQQIGNVVNQANLQLFWNMYNRCARRGAHLCSRELAPPGFIGGGRLDACAPRFADGQLGVSLRRVPACSGSLPLKGRGGAGLRTLVLGLLHAFSPGAPRSSQERCGMWATSLTPTA